MAHLSHDVMTFKIVAGTPVRIAELILGYNGEKNVFLFYFFSFEWTFPVSGPLQAHKGNLEYSFIGALSEKFNFCCGVLEQQILVGGDS